MSYAVPIEVTAVRGRRWPPLLIAGAALLIAAAIALRPIDHDEGQYVAATALMRHGWPYLDFAYLQTPLQPLVLSPLAWLPAGALLVASRAVNGLFALGTILLLWIALRGRVRARSAIIALAALACSQAFLLAASLARNDALPMVLLAGGLALLLPASRVRGPPLRYAGAGLLFGLAASAKISSAVVAAAAALFMLLQWRVLGSRACLAFLGGAVAGFVPTILLAAFGPHRFWFDAITYSLEAPAQWWSSVGRQSLLGPSHRIATLLGFSAAGPVIVALVGAALDRRRSPDRLLLDLLIVGGLVAAYLPKPAFLQYLVPVLPPLFARLAFALDRVDARSRIPMYLTIVACLCGVAYSGSDMLRKTRRQATVAQAVEIGRTAVRLAQGGRIVTLSPEFVAGSGTALDRRFATGPFLFRTHGPLSLDALRYGLSPNWQNVGKALDWAPPKLILVGNEMQPRLPLLPAGLDGPLAAWAIAHKYRAVPLERGFTAYVRD